jgi:hypothetical protein
MATGITGIFNFWFCFERRRRLQYEVARYSANLRHCRLWVFTTSDTKCLLPVAKVWIMVIPRIRFLRGSTISQSWISRLLLLFARLTRLGTQVQAGCEICSLSKLFLGNISRQQLKIGFYLQLLKRIVRLAIPYLQFISDLLKPGSLMRFTNFGKHQDDQSSLLMFAEAIYSSPRTWSNGTVIWHLSRLLSFLSNSWVPAQATIYRDQRFHSSLSFHYRFIIVYCSWMPLKIRRCWSPGSPFLDWIFHFKSITHSDLFIEHMDLFPTKVMASISTGFPVSFVSFPLFE